MIGYVCYADRFAGSLPGVRQHLDYLAELGVSYLHLMPLLRPRPGENDGGYAVADYDAVDPRVGTMADLQALAADLHERGMVLCIDLVLNHTATEHQWARQALAGEPGYREMYLVYPDRTEPDAYESFLSNYYSGAFPGSFARGARFQDNPATGDVRISGSAASLCGVEAALEAGDPAALTAAIRRLESMYAVAFSFGGIPLIYMGDELAVRNDTGWARDQAHEHDNRWMHRPRMDWAVAARRHDPDSVEGWTFAAIRAMSDARRSLLALRAGGSTEILPTESPSVLAYRRVHPRSTPFLALTNFSDVTSSPDAGIIARAGLRGPAHVHSTTGKLTISAGRIELAPWSFVWLTGT
jgi:glycosidase